METSLVREIFFILLAATTGGILVKFLKLQPIIGYIISGVIFGMFLHLAGTPAGKLAEIGAILLLFSIGIELSLSRLGKMFKTAVLGGFLQIITTGVLIFIFLTIFGFDSISSGILAAGFSLSSTAVVVKILADRGEIDTIHGELMIGWLLFQDLAVIPIMVIIPSLAGGGNVLTNSAISLGRALIVIVSVVLLGRKIAPFLLHKIASFNSRELLVISAVTLALGTAMLTSFFGVSAALGAFLAGVVISETQENHAVFAETRPLRDLFVALFFVTLGFLIDPVVLMDNLLVIFAIVLFVIIIKFFVFLFLSFIFGHHGKTAIQASLGLTQIGEFSFIILSQAASLNLVSPEITSIGVSVALISLIFTPLMFKGAVPFWRWIRNITKNWQSVNKLFIGWDKRAFSTTEDLNDHIIVCGYGRTGKWVAKALEALGIEFVIIDYNQNVVKEAKNAGIKAIYGDPSEKEVLEQAKIENAKALIIAIPDRITQEELITRVQTITPDVKIYSRAHFDEDMQRMKFLRVEKTVQPEFEAAVFFVKEILRQRGKTKKEIAREIKSLRQSHSMSI